MKNTSWFSKLIIGESFLNPVWNFAFWIIYFSLDIIKLSDKIISLVMKKLRGG